MKLPLIVFLISCATSFAGEKCSPPESVPPEISRFLEIHPITKGSFDSSDFPKVKEHEKILKSMTKDFVSYTIDPPSVGNDMFTYRVIWNTIAREFWIHQTGGYANVSILYGPIKLKVEQENWPGTYKLCVPVGALHTIFVDFMAPLHFFTRTDQNPGFHLFQVTAAIFTN